MTRPSFATYLSGLTARLFAWGVMAIATVAFAFAFCVSSQAGAQTHGHRAAVQTHRVSAHAHKAACATHARHGSHACSPGKPRKHKAKSEARHTHATGSRHAPVQSKAQTPPAATSAGSPGTTCPDGVNATLDEEGSFACAGGAEPGCQEGFSPVVSDDGSTLVCEPEQNEAGGEEEG
jgi:hypothetical protein